MPHRTPCNFKETGMVKKILLGSCILLSCAACTSEVTRLKETEYLRTHSTKAVVYPEDVDKPAQEKSYQIPESSAKSAAEAEAPELLALPPRLVGVDISDDEEDEESKESEDQAGETLEPVDEELLPEEAE
jgi:hypothetical protein